MMKRILTLLLFFALIPLASATTVNVDGDIETDNKFYAFEFSVTGVPATVYDCILWIDGINSGHYNGATEGDIFFINCNIEQSCKSHLYSISAEEISTHIITYSNTYWLNVTTDEWIQIYYPNDNTTTNVYYGDNDGYHLEETNFVDIRNVNVVILKDQIVTESNVLNDPKILYRSMLVLFMIIVMGFVLIIMVKLMRGTLK